MSTNAMGRLVRLEERLRPPPGCDTCRDWRGGVLGDDDGTTSRPEQCPHCSRVVPFAQTVVIVGVPLDAL